MSQLRPSSPLRLLSQKGGPGGSHHARLVGNRGAPGRFCIYNKAVLEQEGKKSSHLLLKLVENDLCLI